MDKSNVKLRPRFSLLAFLIAVSAIGLVISHWNTSKQLASAEQELRKYRDELGYLSIDDESKFHAVALDSGEPNTWRWRLYLPKGARYEWNIACEDIPANSPPSRAGTMTVSNEPYWESANEVLVTARLREAEDGNWMLSVASKIGDSKNQMSDATLMIPSDKIEWQNKVSSTDGQVIGSNGTVVREPSGPIILLQQRPCEKQPDGSYRPSQNAMPGYMIWLTKP